MSVRGERKKTKFMGVMQRISSTKRHQGKPDVCFSINFIHPVTGKRVWKSIGWRSEGITAEFANQVRMELLGKARKEKFADSVPMGDALLTLGEGWALFERDWLQARNLASRRSDRSRYRRHLMPMETRPLSSFTPHDLETLFVQFHQNGLSKTTAKHILELLQRIMNKMIRWKFWPGPNPFPQVTLPHIDNQRVRFLTPQEANALLSVLEKLSLKTYVMSLISLHCGLRFSEIAGLRLSDIDYDTGTLFIHKSKNGRSRYAYMTSCVEAALKSYPVNGELIFQTRTGKIMCVKDSVFDTAVDICGLNNTGQFVINDDGEEVPIKITDARHKGVFHTLRHTFASWLAMNGTSQFMIAELLGHSSLEMSQRYTHLMPGAKREAARAIDILFRQQNVA